MGLVNLIKQEVSYLTNNMTWRKILISMILISIVFQYRSGVVSGEPYEISTFFLILIMAFSAITIGGAIYRFKTTSIYSDPPKREMFDIILMLIYKLWNRVQACLLISIISLATFLFMEISFSGMLAEMFFFLGIYYNITMVESHKVMLAFKEVDDSSDVEDK